MNEARKRQPKARRGHVCIVSAGAGGGGDLFVCFTIEHSDLYRVGCTHPHQLGALDPATFFGGLGAKLKIGVLKYNTLLPNHCGMVESEKNHSPSAVSPSIERGPTWQTFLNRTYFITRFRHNPTQFLRGRIAAEDNPTKLSNRGIPPSAVGL
jgi:hypothetical protein